VAVQKQSANQIRRIEELQQYVRTVDHVKKLVAELESNRAANPKIIKGICDNIARDLSHMRQRALTANLGTLPDVSGSLAIVAARQGTGINVKLRALQDGMSSLMMQLDQALKLAHETPPEKEKEKKQS
jgi:soluble cytochrome b562